MYKRDLKNFSSIEKRKILIIEDEMINREIIGMMLQEDYDLIFAENGTQALQHIEERLQELSLVLLDLNLPDMKGVDILKQMKADVRTAMIPVIVMTADQDAEVECLTLGAIDFIPKPYPQQKVILARILRTIELSEDRDIIRWTECDALTGVLNREYFFRYAVQFDQHHSDVATDAILVDINHFHMVNERYGSSVGDEVLKKISEKLLAAVRESGGIVCRREADTFLVYCPHRSDYQEILDDVSVEIMDGNHVRPRMGIYSEVDKNIDLERRFDRAKMAADTVKDNFTRSIGIFDNSLHEAEMLAEQLLDEFPTAIREKQFTVYFQPKFDVRPKEPVLNSAEALVRWIHPEKGMISPGIFIPVFEKNGLVRELDSYVWRETSDRENPQGDIFADADTALQRLEKKQQRGYSIY